MSKKALITGITGQDGSYLAELLLAKDYEVHGIVRRTSCFNRDRIEHLLQDKTIGGKRLFLHYGDLADSSNLNRLLAKLRPDELYNLGAQSHVQVSFEVPEYSADVNGLGCLRLLDALREIGLPTRFYQASTSELYGKVLATPQRETTPFNPQSPYAIAKLYAYWIVKNYRQAYTIHASNGIMFNHESPRRGESFVTRKITLSAVHIHHGQLDCLTLGNLDALRDWGYAPDYVDLMWRMQQQEKPDDFVAATGEAHSVREFVERVFALLGRPIHWQGQGLDEVGIDNRSGQTVVRIDPFYYRPTEVDRLLGDASKAKAVLGWEPKVRFNQLVEIMLEGELRFFKDQRYQLGF